VIVSDTSSILDAVNVQSLLCNVHVDRAVLFECVYAV